MAILFPVVLFLVIVGVVSYFRLCALRPAVADAGSAGDHHLASHSARIRRTEAETRIFVVAAIRADRQFASRFAARRFRCQTGTVRRRVPRQFGRCRVLWRENSPGAVLVIAALRFASRIDNPMLRLMLPVAGGGVGYFLPAFILGAWLSAGTTRSGCRCPMFWI